MRQSLRHILSACLFIIILIAGIVFFVQNSQELEFNYVIGTVTLPLSLLILLCLCAGAMLGILAMIPLVLRQRRRMAGLVKQAQMAEREINNLRVMPIKDRP